MESNSLFQKLLKLSHELNNVVLSVAGTSSALDREIPSDSVARPRVDALGRSVDRLQQLAQELESLVSKAEAGGR